MKSILSKYADLLVRYCLEVQEGEKVYVRTTTLAEPLVREVYRSVIQAGGIIEVELDFRGKNRILLNEAVTDQQLQYSSLLYDKAINEFDCFLYIRAPFNLREDQNIDSEKSRIKKEAQKKLLKTYFKRTATRALKRNLCQYPTLANAQEAGMSLEEYETFVFQACKLYEDDPIQAWHNVRKSQQKIVDLLNNRTKIRYQTEDTDIEFLTTERTWINSDGQTNMPSGEVYTSPVENSVNGHIYFSFPGVYMGHEVEGVRLWVKDGYIERWEAKRGKDFLDQVFKIDGARYFGEAAIGTNYNIDKMTKNILFDEKIGGTIHMAIGQSYLQAGGKNQSTIHWDMITDMRNGGIILADDEKIYENGSFLF